LSNLNFEEALAKLEETVNRLEKDQLSLDESLKIFEEGINLYRLCSKELNEVEMKITTIVEENGELKKIPFEYKGDEN
jgi:exodeoxyribonuclease VII small subunit